MDERTKEFYMNSGVFSLPLFKGKVSVDLLKSVSESSDPWQRLNVERIPRGILKMDPATLIVKVVDNQREVRMFLTVASLRQELRVVSYRLQVPGPRKFRKDGLSRQDNSARRQLNKDDHTDSLKGNRNYLLTVPQRFLQYRKYSLFSSSIPSDY